MEEYLSAHVYNEYKTRNILSLADRMQVIREYDGSRSRLSFQSLATKFDCSSKQIKNILMSREAILKSFKEAGDNVSKESRDEALQKRQEKIEFLGKVMFEYIQRVVYFNYGVDEEKVRQKALQIKECIAIENFQPNNGWFKHFKMAYGLADFDIESLRNNVQLTEPKRPHLSAIDMIQFVSRREQKAQKTDVNGKRKRGRPSRLEKLQMQGHNLLEPTIVYETIDDEIEHGGGGGGNGDAYKHHHDEDGNNSYGDDDNHQVIPPPLPRLSHNTFHDKILQRAPTKPLAPLAALYLQSPPKKTKRSDSPFPDIDSPDQALKHVKVLEEYAMLQDNYRAIGLLTQLEQIFKQKTKEEE